MSLPAGALPSIAFHLLTALLKVPTCSLRLTLRSFSPRKGIFTSQGSLWASTPSHCVGTIPPWSQAAASLETRKSLEGESCVSLLLQFRFLASAQHRWAGTLECFSNKWVRWWFEVPL